MKDIKVIQIIKNDKRPFSNGNQLQKFEKAKPFENRLDEIDTNKNEVKPLKPFEKPTISRKHIKKD